MSTGLFFLLSFHFPSRHTADSVVNRIGHDALTHEKRRGMPALYIGALLLFVGFSSIIILPIVSRGRKGTAPNDTQRTGQDNPDKRNDNVEQRREDKGNKGGAQSSNGQGEQHGWKCRPPAPHQLRPNNGIGICKERAFCSQITRGKWKETSHGSLDNTTKGRSTQEPARVHVVGQPISHSHLRRTIDKIESRWTRRARRG